MVDTGLANTISFRFSEDKGRMLETLVYQHLKRLGYEIYFHRDKKECDFIVKKGLEITESIQVTCSLSDQKTKEREIEGLKDAMRHYTQSVGMILTLDESSALAIDVNGTEKQVIIKPVWKWMLENTI